MPQGTLTGPATFVAQVNDAVLNLDGNKMALKYIDDLTIVENTLKKSQHFKTISIVSINGP